MSTAHTLLIFMAGALCGAGITCAWVAFSVRRRPRPVTAPDDYSAPAPYHPVMDAHGDWTDEPGPRHRAPDDGPTVMTSNHRFDRPFVTQRRDPSGAGIYRSAVQQ